MGYNRPRIRMDTRRKRHGEVLGGHNGGSYAGWGHDYKNTYWRAERQYWKRYSRAHTQFDESYEEEIQVKLGSVVGAYGDLNWKGW